MFIIHQAAREHGHRHILKYTKYHDMGQVFVVERPLDVCTTKYNYRHYRYLTAYTGSSDQPRYPEIDN